MTVESQPLVQLVSVTFGLAVTVAVFAIVAVVPDGTVPVTVYVTFPPATILTVSEMSPLPEAAQVLPVEATQVQWKPCPANSAGKVSMTEVPGASEGPVFSTLMV